jgi:hypothetical protein
MDTRNLQIRNVDYSLNWYSYHHDTQNLEDLKYYIGTLQAFELNHIVSSPAMQIRSLDNRADITVRYYR